MGDVIPLALVSSLSPADRKAKEDVLMMAYNTRQGAQRVIDRLREDLGLESDDRRVPPVIPSEPWVP